MSKDRRLAPLLATVVLALGSAAARADVTAQWTSIAADTVREARIAPAAAERGLAAVRQAIEGVSGTGKGKLDGNGNGGDKAHAEHLDAAVAVAAFAVLETLYPDQRETLDARLAVTLSHIPETDAKAAGAALGRRVATEIVRAMK